MYKTLLLLQKQYIWPITKYIPFQITIVELKLNQWSLVDDGTNYLLWNEVENRTKPPSPTINT